MELEELKKSWNALDEHLIILFLQSICLFSIKNKNTRCVIIIA